METMLTILLAALGSAGFFTFLQFLINRHDNKNIISKKLDELMEQNINNELAITKVQLQILFALQPKNHDTILTVAERYFIKLNGDAEMYNEFVSWATKEKVSVSWFEIVKAREESNGKK